MSDCKSTIQITMILEEQIQNFTSERTNQNLLEFAFLNWWFGRLCITIMPFCLPGIADFDLLLCISMNQPFTEAPHEIVHEVESTPLVLENLII